MITIKNILCFLGIHNYKRISLTINPPSDELRKICKQIGINASWKTAETYKCKWCKKLRYDEEYS